MSERDPDEAFERALAGFNMAGGAGAVLYGLGAIGVAVGVPRPVLYAYLIVITPVYIALIVRARRHRSSN